MRGQAYALLAPNRPRPSLGRSLLLVTASRPAGQLLTKGYPSRDVSRPQNTSARTTKTHGQTLRPTRAAPAVEDEARAFSMLHAHASRLTLSRPAGQLLTEGYPSRDVSRPQNTSARTTKTHGQTLRPTRAAHRQHVPRLVTSHTCLSRPRTRRPMFPTLASHTAPDVSHPRTPRPSRYSR